MRITTPMNEADALAASAPPEPPPDGDHRGTITEATEGVSPRGNQTLRALIVVTVEGREYRLVDVLSATPRGMLRLRHAAAAVGALADFEAGQLEARQFIGRAVVVTTQIERKNGQRRAVVTDYAAAAPSGVSALRRIAGG